MPSGRYLSRRLLIVAAALAVVAADAVPVVAQTAPRSQVQSPSARAAAIRQRARRPATPAQPRAIARAPIEGKQSYGNDPLGRLYGKDPVRALYGADPLQKLYGRSTIEKLYGRDPVQALGLPANRVPRPPGTTAPEPGPSLDQATRFQALDVNRDGYISSQEYVGEGRRVSGISTGGRRQALSARRASRFSKADTNRDGRISVEELTGAANPRF